MMNMDRFRYLRVCDEFALFVSVSAGPSHYTITISIAIVDVVGKWKN